jgi:hypothetical protein
MAEPGACDQHSDGEYERDQASAVHTHLFFPASGREGEAADLIRRLP